MIPLLAVTCLAYGSTASRVSKARDAQGSLRTKDFAAREIDFKSDDIGRHNVFEADADMGSVTLTEILHEPSSLEIPPSTGLADRPSLERAQAGARRPDRVLKTLALTVVAFNPIAAWSPSSLAARRATQRGRWQAHLPSLLRARVAMTAKAEIRFNASDVSQIAAAVGDAALDLVTKTSSGIVNKNVRDKRPEPVEMSLQRMKRDIRELDKIVSSKSQLTVQELIVLASTVVVASFSPLQASAKLTEVLVPAMGAIAAAIGLSAEYVGKTAVSTGKEIAAEALRASAEAEGLLAKAERSKAVVPLCVGISATASALALLAPVVLSEISQKYGLQFVTEALLICPLFGALASAVASLQTAEAESLASRAQNLGTRRFSSSKSVGRTWLSATEQIAGSNNAQREKLIAFAQGVIVAPLLAVIAPGELAFKSIVAAALAAAQTAYYLARVEYSIAIAVDNVALKSRQAAVSDTYANQGARAGAILPFTSATGSLCAATSVFGVEFLDYLPNLALKVLAAGILPLLGSLFAAAASVSKARCEIDAVAATEAANELSRIDTREDFEPLRDLRRLTVLAWRPLLQLLRPRNIKKAIKLRLEELRIWFQRLRNPRNDPPLQYSDSGPAVS